MPRTGPGQGRIPGEACHDLRINRIGSQHMFPFGPYSVADLDRHRRTEGLAVADPGQDRHLIAFENHPRTPASTQSTPGQLAVDVSGRDLKMGGQAINGRDQGWSVRLPSGEVSEHDRKSVTSRRHGPSPA